MKNCYPVFKKNQDEIIENNFSEMKNCYPVFKKNQDEIIVTLFCDNISQFQRSISLNI